MGKYVHKECHSIYESARPSNYPGGIHAQEIKAEKPNNKYSSQPPPKVHLESTLRKFASSKPGTVRNKSIHWNDQCHEQPPLYLHVGNVCLVRSRGGLLVLAVIGGGGGVGRDGGDRSGGRDGCGRCHRSASGVASSRQTSTGRADAGLDQVLEPGTGVELAVDGVDEVWLSGAVGVRDDLHADQADNGLGLRDRGGVGGDPADDDGVASVPEVETLEVDRGLLALSDLELFEAGEGRGEEIKGLGGIALRAGVDQGVNGFGVVGEVGGEDSVGERIAVANDQSCVVGCDLVGLSVSNTTGLANVVTLLSWSSNSAKNGEREEGDGAEGRHFAFWSVSGLAESSKWY